MKINIYSRYGKYPISKGHLLLITKQHVSCYFDLSTNEIYAIQDALIESKEYLERKYSADGYNIDINDGAAAG